MNSPDSDTPLTVSKSFKFKKNVLVSLFAFLWKYFPSLTKLIVKRAVFSPSAYRINPIERGILDRGQMFEMPLRDKSIICWKWGVGPAILLAHGWNGRGIQLHVFIEPLVQAGYSVIIFDAPGHGHSPGRYSSYFEYSDLIRAFFRCEKDLMIKGVIAHSLGAAAVINGMHKENFYLAAALIAPPLRLEEILRKMFIKVGFPLQILNELIYDFELQFGYNLNIDNPIHLLPQIKSNILFVHDKKDKAIPYSDSYNALKQIPRFQLYTTNGLGHKKILFDHKTSIFIIDYIRRCIINEK